MGGGSVASGAPIVDTKSKEYRREAKFLVLNILRALLVFIYLSFISSVRSSNSHPDLLVIHPPTTPLFQITPVLNTGLSLSEPLQLYKGYNAI